MNSLNKVKVNAKIRNDIAKASGNHAGDTTHHHGQFITPDNFRTTKATSIIDDVLIAAVETFL